MTTREHKEKTIVGPLIGVILVITIIAAFAVVILRQTAAQAQKEEQTAQAVQAAQQAQQEQAQERSQPQEDAVVPASSFQFPSDMKAAMVEPGREFLTVLSGHIEQAELALSGEEQQLQQQQTLDPPEIDEQQVRDEIDQMVQDAAELGLDTLFVSLENAYGTLWESPGAMTSFDARGYLYDSAHQAGPVCRADEEHRVGQPAGRAAAGRLPQPGNRLQLCGLYPDRGQRQHGHLHDREHHPAGQDCPPGCAGGKRFAAGGAGGQPGVGHRRRAGGRH